MSELPDASFSHIGDETLDQLADLPPIPTTGRAVSRGPSMSPRKGVPRRASRGLSAQPNGASSKPASRAGSRAPSLGPTPNLGPSSAAKGRTSRRSSRVPSLGPAPESSAPAAPSSPPKIIGETTTTIIEKTGPVEASPVVPGGGSTFAVPEDDIDESSFFGQDLGTSPTQGLYPDLSVEDDTLGF